MIRGSGPRRFVLRALAVVCVIGTSVQASEPRCILRVPPFPAAEFPNFSAVTLPKQGYQALEILLEQTLEDVQPSTIRVTLNEMPMTPFVAINRMPRGVRVIVKLGISLSPDYALRGEGENVLGFSAVDNSGVTYRGQFFLAIDPKADAPRLSASRARAGATGVEPPPENSPPRVTITSDWPAVTAQRTLILAAHISDEAGLRRIVLEVNGKDVEEVVFHNERPVRKKNGKIARGALPGEVTGNGRQLGIRVPVTLGSDRVNVVAVRAENVLGLSTRADKAVEVTKR